MARAVRFNQTAFAGCASWLDAAEDDAAATAPDAPRPTGSCAGLGAACRGCAAAFRHTRSAYTELRQDQLDALNRRRQAEMIVFEDTSSSGGGTSESVPPPELGELG